MTEAYKYYDRNFSRNVNNNVTTEEDIQVQGSKGTLK